ncbi:MAG: YciI family protein [Polyangiales bacterium]
MTSGDFLLLVFEDEAAHEALPPWEMAAHLDAQDRFAATLRARGALVDGGRLRPSREGRRVRGEGAHPAGKPALERGPFDGESLALALFYRVRAATLDEAAALIADCPTLAADVIEVRPVMKGWLDGDRALRRGRVFGFVVLGCAPSHEAWDEVMDRIDAETREVFPARAFLGGVRLHGPGRGRRRAGHAVVDGPFAEGREVIGGLFFVRAASVDDAVSWAVTSPFVAHGALELRELWRS